MNLKDWLTVFRCIGIECTYRAKELIYRGKAKKAVGIGAGGDETTEFDKSLEDIVLSRLKAIGDVCVISEESGIVEYGSSKRTVIADPLDGSVNAKSDLPIFTTALAYTDSSKPSIADLQVAYVKCLTTGDEFYAIRNKGAYRNKKRIKSSSKSTIKILGLELYPYPNLSKTLKIIEKSTRVRSLGSISYDLCLVAAGVFDALVDFRNRLRILDMSPAILIIQEAGGIVTDEGGSNIANIQIDTERRTSVIAAGNKKLHNFILKSVM
jgi:myo-inositol-1(or 4)-monophosphatase